MNKAIPLLLVMCLLGCSKALDLQLEPEVKVFFSDDAKKNIHLTQQDKAYIVLSEWLHENKANWLVTSGRYPGGVYIKSGEYGIQVTESKVVIYSTLGKKPKAIYVQEIKNGELSTILELTK